MLVDWKVNIIKMTILPKQSTDSMQSLSNYKDIFHRTQTKYFKVCLEVQKTQNRQSYPEEEKWSWRNQAPGLQTTSKMYGTGTKTEIEISGTG